MTPEPPVLAKRAADPCATGTSVPSWISLRLHGASIAIARRFAGDVISGHVRDADHAHTIVLIVSELVTNALRIAGQAGPCAPHERPVKLGVLPTALYVHLQVTDPDRRPIASTAACPPASEGGWGLGIVDMLSAVRWATYGEATKTIHVIVPAPGVDLARTELDALRARADLRVGF
jgi:anti-sigma regulatory factor (Ser/Thr protein kinase)